MEPIVTGVDFVYVPTQDFERSVAFYGETFGLPCVARYGRMPGAEFQAGNLTIAVIESAKFGMEFTPITHPIGLRVEDVHAARGALEDRGVAFAAETMDTGVCHMAHFADPDGNRLMLHRRYAPKE